MSVSNATRLAWEIAIVCSGSYPDRHQLALRQAVEAAAGAFAFGRVIHRSIDASELDEQMARDVLARGSLFFAESGTPVEGTVFRWDFDPHHFPKRAQRRVVALKAGDGDDAVLLAGLLTYHRGALDEGRSSLALLVGAPSRGLIAYESAETAAGLNFVARHACAGLRVAPPGELISGAGLLRQAAYNQVFDELVAAYLDEHDATEVERLREEKRRDGRQGVAIALPSRVREPRHWVRLHEIGPRAASAAAGWSLYGTTQMVPDPARRSQS